MRVSLTWTPRPTWQTPANPGTGQHSVSAHVGLPHRYILSLDPPAPGLLPEQRANANLVGGMQAGFIFRETSALMPSIL